MLYSRYLLVTHFKYNSAYYMYFFYLTMDSPDSENQDRYILHMTNHNIHIHIMVGEACQVALVAKNPLPVQEM